jgi:hypothetical protein
MKYLWLAILAAFSLSVMAGKPTKEQATREPALQGADACDFTIDQKGTKRQQQSAQKQQECRTFNESRSNNLRDAGNTKAGSTVRRPGDAGTAVSGPGVPGNHATDATR